MLSTHEAVHLCEIVKAYAHEIK